MNQNVDAIFGRNLIKEFDMKLANIKYIKLPINTSLDESLLIFQISSPVLNKIINNVHTIVSI